MTPARELQHVSSLALMAACLMACSQQAPSAASTNFDSCLITHMAAIAMLQDAADKDSTELRKAVIASQNELLRDDAIDKDELAQRTSVLMHAYSDAANVALAEAEATGTPMRTLATDAIACGKAVSA
ncbi:MULTISPECIES: hypothetical protein [Hyphomonas]|nr:MULTISPECIES: hypothetical protein [Hyphomonas]